MGSSELDGLLSDLGVCGRYPFGFWLLLNVVSVYHNFLFMGNSLVSYKTEFRCGDFTEEYAENLTTAVSPYDYESLSKFCDFR